MPGQPLRVLVLEDNPDDAELTILELRRAGFEPDWKRVQSGADFVAALREPFDLILADYNLPDFDAAAALALVAKAGVEVPFIIVSGSIGEDAAVKAMQSGAADYVLKDRLARLGQAAKRALERHRDRRERVLAQEKLRHLERREAKRRVELAERGRRQAELRFAHILELAPDGILTVDEDGDVHVFNRGAETLFGHPPEEIAGMSLRLLIPEGLPADFTGSKIVRARRGDGTDFPVEISASRLQLDGETMTTLICRDVTERLRAEEDLIQLYALLDQRLRSGIEMVADLTGSLDAADVVERVLRRLAGTVNADAGVLMQVDPDGGLQVLDGFDRQELHEAPAGGDFAPLPVVETALRRGSPAQAAIDSRVDAAAAWLPGALQAAALPIRVDDQTTVVALLGRRAEASFSENDLETLRVIGSVAALALRNAQLYTAAQAANLAKSEFLNMAAHELRTPLSVVSGYLSLLADGSLGEPGPQWRPPLEIMLLKSEELNKLVDSLLQAARLEARATRTERKVTDLTVLARSAAEKAEARAQLLHGTLVLQAPEEPVLVEVDPAKVERILSALIDNALTYTSGSPWVKVEVGSDGRVAVEDNGPGIPVTEREVIFERFHRIHDPAQPAKPGTGLGLYIARELARQHGGSLEVGDGPGGRGSTFVLSLDAVRAGTRRRGRPPAAVPSPA